MASATQGSVKKIAAITIFVVVLSTLCSPF